MKLLPLLLLLLIVFHPAFSQEQEPESDTETILISEEEIAAIAGDENSVYYINTYKYNVTGITLPFMLNTKTELKTGEEIKGKTNLIKFIKEKKQLLINERVLKDNVEIKYTVEDADEDGRYPVNLQIYTEDTWNIIALPYPKLDSNYGFSITIKARDYNFLGTMNPLRIDLGYRLDQDKRSFFELMVDSGIPFEAFGLNWYFDFDNYFDYRPNLIHSYHHFYYKNRTAISVDIPIQRTTLNLWFAESFIVNEANAESDVPALGEVQEGLYMQSYPNITWTIPTGLEIGDLGELYYVPSIYAQFNHEFPMWPLSYNRIGPFYNFSHYINFGRIDWKNNLRDGISIYASNSYSFNVHYFYKDDAENFNPWGYSYSVRAIRHFIFIEDWLGLSARLYHRHWIKTYNEYAGDVLRGVYDRDVSAEMIFSVNLDLQFKAIRFLPSKWFPNSKFMRVFDFDMFINPVIDAAWYKPYQQEASLDRDFVVFGAGLEFIVYPHRFRSLYFRVSAAWDFSRVPDEVPGLISDLELFMGMELHY